MNEYLDNKYRKEAQELEELHSRKQETERQRLLKIRQEIQYANTQTLQAKKKIQKYEEEMSQDQLEHLKHQDLDSILQIQQEKQMQRDKLIAYKQELDSQLLTNHRLNEDKLCMSAKELELNRVYLKSIGL